jgi:hypothetical protein
MNKMKDYIKNDCPYFEENCPGGLSTGSEKLTCECAKFKAYIGAKDPTVVAEELKSMNIIATEKMNIMLSMQKIFAGRFHKIDGLTKEEIDHWTNEYLVCIEDEIVEASEFLNIYPEVIKKFDVVEYRKELIDILHFMMDGMLVAGMTYSDLKDYYGKYHSTIMQTDILDVAVELEQFAIDELSTMTMNSTDKDLYILNYLFRDIRLVRQCISWKHWKKPSATIDKDKMFMAYAGMFSHLVQAFLTTGMTPEDIYNVYVHKNIENILRQKAGY